MIVVFKRTVNLWVKGGEEAPDHGEDGRDVGGVGGGQVCHWAEIKEGGRAGKVAELLMEGAGLFEVVIDPHTPASPVQGFHQRQVLLDSGPVLLLQVLGRVGRAVEGERHPLLATATSPGVPGAGAFQ